MTGNADPVFQAAESLDDGLAVQVDEDGTTMVAGKWYFWNETWSDLSEPFDTEAGARAALEKYAVQL